MPTYAYECPACKAKTDVHKRVSQIDEEELCDSCKGVMRRYLTPVRFNGAKEWNSDEWRTFNPAFGKVVPTKMAKLNEMARLKDEGKEVQEIGNEPLDSLHKWHDTKREDIRNERWRED